MTSPSLADKTSAFGAGTRSYTSPETDLPYMSVTTAIDLGMPKHLEPWTAKTVAELAVDEVEKWLWKDPYLAATDQTPEEIRRRRVDWLKGAADRVKTTAGKLGDGAHSYLEAKIKGEEISDITRAMAGNYAPVIDRWVERWTPDLIASEITVFSDTHGYAGTLDLIVHIPGRGVCFVDLKTSRSGIWASTALQVSAAIYADYSAHETGVRGSSSYKKERRPIPKADGAFGLWMRPLCTTPGCEHRPPRGRTTKAPAFKGDECLGYPDGVAEMYPLDHSEETFEVFCSALKNAHWSRVMKPTAVGAPVLPPMLLPTDPPGTFHDEIEGRVLAIIEDNGDALVELAESWPEDIPTIKKVKKGKAVLDHDELVALSMVLNWVEANHEMAFASTYVPPRQEPDLRGRPEPLPLPQQIADLRDGDSEPLTTKQAVRLAELIEALPKDLQGALEHEAMKHSASVRGALTRGQARTISAILGTAQTIAVRRLESLHGATANLDRDLLAAALNTTAGTILDPDSKKFDKKATRLLQDLTQNEAVTFLALAEALRVGWIRLTADERAAKVLAMARRDALVSLYGSKTAVSAEARRVIREYELAVKPGRSADDVAAIASLSALLLWLGPPTDDALTRRSAEYIQATEELMAVELGKAEAKAEAKAAEAAESREAALEGF